MSSISLTAQKSLNVLECVAGANRPLSVSEIAEFVGIQRNAAYRSVFTLCSEGYLNQHSDGKYSLSAKLWAISSQWFGAKIPMEPLQEYLDGLSQKTGLHASIGVLEGSFITVIAIGNCDTHPCKAKIGARIPAHCSSMGRAIFGNSSLRLVSEIMESGLDQHTEHTITQPFEFRKEVEASCKRGYGVANLEVAGSLRSVGVDISKEISVPRLAMSLNGASEFFDEECIDEFGEMIVANKELLKARLDQSVHQVQL